MKRDLRTGLPFAFCFAAFSAFAQCGEPPADDPPTARFVAGAPGVYTVNMSVADATFNPLLSMPCDLSAGHDVWFRVTPTVTGTCTFSTCTTNTTYDTVVQAWFDTGSDVWLAPLACVRNTTTLECENGCDGWGAVVEIPVQANSNYYFQVASTHSNSAGCTLCLGVKVTLTGPLLYDCNTNGVEDADDIAGGYSSDCDTNGVPDECQPDADQDGVPNVCDPEPAPYLSPQMLSMSTLGRASLIEPEIRMERGRPVFVLAEVPHDPAVAEDPVARGMDYLDTYRNAYRLRDIAADLHLKRIATDPEGETHLFMGQHRDGIPVFGSEMAVHVTSNAVRGTQGRYLAGEFQLPPPVFRAGDAEVIAMSDLLGSCSQVDVEGVTRLMYFNASLFDDQPDVTRLAWRVNLRSACSPWLYLVDSHTGEILFRQLLELAGDRPGEHFDLNTANETQSDTCWFWTTDDDQWFDEDGPVGSDPPDADGWQTFTNLHTTYHFFWDHFSLAGWHGMGLWGGSLDVYVHCTVGNASYIMNCDDIRIRTGFCALDVFAHEYTHGVTDHSAAFIYAPGQPGSLHESFSDVFGLMVENEGKEPYAGGWNWDWWMGEGVPGGPFRCITNPPLKGGADHMSNYFTNGSIYGNSTIPSKAFSLMAAGGTHHAITVERIQPVSRVRDLYYHALKYRLTENAQFMDVRDALLATAKQWQGYGDTICTIMNAWAAVGLGEADLDCDGYADSVDSDDDGDHIPDSTDNCPGLPNPDQEDTDGDGMGDVCDPDDDNDGILDDGNRSGVAGDWPCAGYGQTNNCDDNCQKVPNPTQTYVGGLNPLWSGTACKDDDWDGVFNPTDNCVSVANVLQENTDGDASGDACDTDMDNDGVPNTVDNCSRVSNATQTDTDGDGVGNACDHCPTTVDPSNADTDSDGLGNACDTDIDNDGILNASDNCPTVYNPDQSDYFHAGTGDACRATLVAGKPWQAVQGMIRFVSGTQRPLVIPFDPCEEDFYPDYLPEGFMSEIVLNLPEVSMSANVMDDSGRIVATAGGTKQIMRFAPAADTFFRAPAGIGTFVKRTGSGTSPVYRGRQYFLQIYPGPTTLTDHDYDMTMYLRSGMQDEIAQPWALEFLRDAEQTNGVSLSWSATGPIQLDWTRDLATPDWLGLTRPIDTNRWSGILPSGPCFIRVRMVDP